MSTPDLSAAIHSIWQQKLPETRDRIATLQRAAEQLSETRTLDPDLRTEATAAAHKLAGSLGMFGFDAGTQHARDIEHQLTAALLPQPERLQAAVEALTAALPLED